MAENSNGGKFANIMSGLGAAGAFGSTVASLFGPSVKKQLKWQKQAQMELNQQAAELNYQYGEKAAENAYNRQMQMYERSYQDNSYAAMRKQIEDAGLSVGLMYGGGGASGGGAGSMSGAPQAETGGATAGDAGAVLSAAVAMENVKTQRIQAAADAALKYAQVENLKAQTGKTGEETLTERVLREIRANLMKEQGTAQWIQNVESRWAGLQEMESSGDYSEEHEMYGQYRLIANSLTNQRAQAEVAKVVAEKNLTGKNVDKVAGEIAKIQQDILTGRAEEAMKKAQKLETEAKTQDIKLKNGEETNWRTWVQLAFDGIGGLCKVGDTVSGFITPIKVAKMIKSASKGNKQIGEMVDEWAGGATMWMQD